MIIRNYHKNITSCQTFPYWLGFAFELSYHKVVQSAKLPLIKMLKNIHPFKSFFNKYCLGSDSCCRSAAVLTKC